MECGRVVVSRAMLKGRSEEFPQSLRLALVQFAVEAALRRHVAR